MAVDEHQLRRRQTVFQGSRKQISGRNARLPEIVVYNDSGALYSQGQHDDEKASEPQANSVTDRSIRQLLTLQWHRLKPLLGLRNDKDVRIEIARIGKSVVANSPLGIHGFYLLQNIIRRAKVLVIEYGNVEQLIKI